MWADCIQSSRCQREQLTDTDRAARCDIERVRSERSPFTKETNTVLCKLETGGTDLAILHTDSPIHLWK